MKGLLYNDFFTLWRLRKALFVLTAGILAFYVFCGQSSFIVILLLMYASMFITWSVAAVNQEEFNTGWRNFVGTLPLSRAKIVLEKYLLILILSSGASMLYYIMLAVQKLIANEPFSVGNFADLAAPVMLFAFITVYTCMNQISIFCFTSAKGSYYFSLVVLICYLAVAVLSLANDVLSLFTDVNLAVLSVFANPDNTVLSVFALLISFAVWGLSIGISYLGYRRKNLV